MIPTQLLDPYAPREPVPRPIGVVINGLLLRWRLAMLSDAYRAISKPRLRPPKLR